MQSPFKFLDSFTKEDKDIFFGREQETEELYHKIFESKILLVYGVSGTGKSSLIQCGLGNKFNESDWLPISIRRGSNINESLFKAINNRQLSQTSDVLKTSEVSEPQTTNYKLLKRLLRSLYLDHFKPIYLIFDQFEELFIFGNQAEKEEFIQSVKKISESDLNVKFLFVIREEYLANITEFERQIPEFLENRIRIEKMQHKNAISCIEGPCKAYGIEVEQGFSELLLNKLSPRSNEIELTYLQVFLDKIFRSVIAKHEAISHSSLSPSPKGEGWGEVFPLSILHQLGDVKDLLGSFLEEQISALADPDSALAILKSFVSVKGTKRQITEEEINEHCKTIGVNLHYETYKTQILHFVNIRILRDKDETGRYELRHDAIAAKIYEKITLVEKELMEIRQFIENAFANFEKREVLLNPEDLKYIAPYENKLFLPENLEQLIANSKKQILKAKKRKQRIAFATAISILIVMFAFTYWAMNERNKAEIAKQKSTALYYNSLAKEVVNENPTNALLLAEYAYSLDSTNNDIYKNILRIYYDNSISANTIDLKAEEITSLVFSPDGKYFLTIYGSYENNYSVNLWDTKGNIILKDMCIYEYAQFPAFSPDSKTFLVSLSDSIKIFDLKGNILNSFKITDLYYASFSPDGNKILCAYYNGEVKIYDLKTKSFYSFTPNISKIVLSQDGNTLAATTSSDSVILMNLKGKIIQTFICEPSDEILYSPDGDIIITGTYNGGLNIIDIKNNKIKSFKAHNEEITNITFSTDSKTFISNSKDNTTKLWDIKGSELQVFKDSKYANFSFTGDSIITVSPNGILNKFALENKTIKFFEGEGIERGEFSHDGNKLLLGNKLIDLNGDIIQKYKINGHNITLYNIKFSPDENKVLFSLITHRDLGSFWIQDSTYTQLYDIKGNKLLNFGTKENQNTVFSPDGKSILISIGSFAQLIDLEGNILQRFESYENNLGHKNDISSVAFSPDGKSVLTGSSDKTAILWSIDGKILQRFKHNDFVRTVNFSPKGKHILTASGDKIVRLWDLEANELQQYKLYSNIGDSKFSPDGQMILTLSQDKKIRLWDLKGNLLQIIECNELASSSNFAPDGKKILNGSFTNGANLVDLKTCYNDFKNLRHYDDLNVKSKLKYDILSFSDIENTKNDNELIDAANWYYDNYLEQSNFALKAEYFNCALKLFKKLIIITDVTKYNLTYLKILFAQNIDGKINNNEEINQLINHLLETNSLIDILKVATTLTEIFNNSDYQCLSNDLNMPDIILELYTKAIDDKDINPSIRKTIAISCSKFAFLLLKNNNCFDLRDKAMESLKIALLADKNNKLIYTVLPFCYLYMNDWEKAKETFLLWKDSTDDYSNDQDFYSDKISDLEKTGYKYLFNDTLTISDFKKVKALLNDSSQVTQSSGL